MDNNKAQKLRDINYAIVGNCGICVYGIIRENSDWGECLKHEYNHEKHTESKRHLSIFRYGKCSDFEAYVDFENYIHGFAEFFEK